MSSGDVLFETANGRIVRNVGVDVEITPVTVLGRTHFIYDIANELARLQQELKSTEREHHLELDNISGKLRKLAIYLLHGLDDEGMPLSERQKEAVNAILTVMF